MIKTCSFHDGGVNFKCKGKGVPRGTLHAPCTADHVDGLPVLAHAREPSHDVSAPVLPHEPHVRAPEFEIRRRHPVMPLERTVEVPASPPSVSFRAL